MFFYVTVIFSEFLQHSPNVFVSQDISAEIRVLDVEHTVLRVDIVCK